MLAWLVRGLAPSATVEIEDMDFSKMTLAVQIAEVLNYDDRTPPNWHGHIGHAEVSASNLLITRSYASPREGANEERLVISLDGAQVLIQRAAQMSQAAVVERGEAMAQNHADNQTCLFPLISLRIPHDRQTVRHAA